MEYFHAKGDLLQIYTKNGEVYEGRFHCLNEDKTKLSLYDVQGIKPGEELLEGVYHYYVSELRDVIKIEEPEHIVVNLKVSQDDYDELLKLSKKSIYINQVDNIFHEAVDDLNKCKFVALSTDGASMGRNCCMPLIVMSTPQQIYIFDLQVMTSHAFDAGLRKLLETDVPKKIIHDCRKISDCLLHKHNVQLKGVFDTQVGDLLITKDKRGKLPDVVKSLSQCLNLYLGLPLDLVEEKVEMVKCTERPISQKMKDTLAMNVTFLHLLAKEINKEMERPFWRGVECYIENVRSRDYYKAWELSGQQNQLPKEFYKYMK